MILLRTFLKLSVSRPRIRQSSLDYWVLLFLLLFFGSYSLHLGQDINWDLKNYHWYNPYALLHHRMGFDLAPAQLQTYYNPLLDLPFYAFVSWIQYSVPIAFLMGGIHAIGVFYLYKIVDLLLPDRYPYRVCYLSLSILIGATGTAALPVIGATFYDSHLSVLVLGSLFLVVNGVVSNSDNPAWKPIALSGLIAGAATGLKLPYGVYAVALCVALLTYKATLKRNCKFAFLFGISVLMGFLAFDGFWMWRMYRMYQNPLFPYFNNIFRSDYAEYVGFNTYPFGPRSLKMALLFPFYIAQENTMLVSEPPLRDWRLAVIMLLVIAVGIVGMCLLERGLLLDPERALYKQRFGWRILFIFCFVGYITWLGLYSCHRYFIPLEMLTGPLIVYLCWLLFNTGLWRLGAIAILAFLIMITARYPSWGRMKFGKRYFDIKVSLPLENSLVIISTYGPLAYLIPFLSADARFVRPESNLTSLSYKNKMQQEIDEIIGAHKGPLFLVEYRAQEERKIGDGILSHYLLRRNEQACVVIQANVDRGIIQLCPLERILSDQEILTPNDDYRIR